MFTAYPPRPGESAQGELEDEPTTTKRKPPSSGRPANQTMVFGQDPAAASAPPKGPNQTMVFGAQPTKAPPPAAPARPAHQTMIFGGGQQPPAAAPPSQPANQTMMFGGPAVQAAPPPPAAKPASQTMVFGTPAGQQAAHAPATAPANQTLVFGAGPVAQPPAAHQTVTFGTPAGQQAAAKEPPARAPAPNQTLVFGGSPVAPPKQNTVMFGTAAGQQAASAAPPPAAPANQTLVFGANPVSAPEPKSTQLFGAAPAQPKANQTMMFGKPPEAVAAPNKTMAFGTPKVDRELDSDGEPEMHRTESTVRVDLEQMMRQHQGDSELTADPDAESPEAVQARHDRTNLFAMSSMQETTKPDAKAPSPNSGTAPELARLSLDGAQTLPPNMTSEEFFSTSDRQPDPDPPGVSTLMEPGGLDSHATIKHDGPIGSTLPNLSPVERATDLAHRSPMSLDLLASETPNTSPEASTARTSELSDEAVAAAVASGGRRRVVVAVVIVLLLLLAGGAFVVWQLFGKQLLGREVDPKLRQDVLQAVERLRQDDTELRKKEIEELEKLVKANPTFVDGHAALVLGLALDLDDLNAEHSFLKVRYDTLTAQHAVMTKEDPKKGAIAKRINVLADRSKELAPQITAAWQRVTKAGASLDGVLGERTPAATSALYLLKAVRGEPLSSPSPDDYWGKLAPAVAAVNATKQNPNDLKAALESINALRSDEGSTELARPHLLAARVFLALKDEAKAKEAIEQAAKNGPKLLAATAGLAVIQE